MSSSTHDMSQDGLQKFCQPLDIVSAANHDLALLHWAAKLCEPKDAQEQK